MRVPQVSVVLHQNDGLLPVATFNCGCSSRKGETQLKLLIQWLAASAAILPHVIYFAAAEPNLNKVIFCLFTHEIFIFIFFINPY